MRLIFLGLVVGCSFDHGVLVAGGDGGAVDAGVGVGVDGAMDAPAITPPTDAPPCADDDSDGVCNTADDWPCGAKPAEPGATVSFTNNGGATSTAITQVNLDGSARLAVVAPSDEMSLTLQYAIADTACTGSCVDQVEIGWVPGNRLGCVFDGVVPRQTGASGSVSVIIRAPMTRQVYDLRVNLGQNFACNYGGANGWWGGTPAATKTIAKLCVH